MSPTAPVLILSYKDTSHIGLRPTYVTFYHNNFFKGPISKSSRIFEVLRFETSITNYRGRGEDIIQSITMVM